jgi:protein gp37
MLVQWFDEIEGACRDARAAFFFKQWGGVRNARTGRRYKGMIFDEMPTSPQSL